MSYDLERTGNYIEACFWAAVGLVVVIVAIRRRAWRREAAFAGVTFVIFGASDVVEAQTGAWWRPWWLLVWKASCVTVLAVLLARHARRRSGSR